MANKILQGLRVAALVTDGFEQSELTSPLKQLRQHGAAVDIISLASGKIRGMNHLVPGKRVTVDRTLEQVSVDDYDALLIPGGLANPDTLRASAPALAFVRAFDQAQKPIATICHGPWVLASAGLVRGRNVTSWPNIQDDLRNAGANWTDAPLVHDGNWISSRSPRDLPVFNPTMVAHFHENVPMAGRQVRAQEQRQRQWGWMVAGAGALAMAYVVTRHGKTLRSPAAGALATAMVARLRPMMDRLPDAKEAVRVLAAEAGRWRSASAQRLAL